MMADREIEARHRARLEPWARKLVRLIADKLEDARAHAGNAVTVTLRDTPDGRATAAKIKRSRSFAAANSRLDELLAAIAGDSDVATDGLVHDATEAFYADSFALWHGQIPPRFRVSSDAPTAQGRAYARGLLWYGLPVRRGLEASFATARNQLLAAVGTAGTSSTSRRAGVDALDGWEQRARSSLITRAGLALNDANQRADLQAMRDVILPQYRGK